MARCDQCATGKHFLCTGCHCLCPTNNKQPAPKAANCDLCDHELED